MENSKAPEDSINEELLKNYWKTGMFIIEDETTTCREKVNRLRNLMFLIHRYLAIGKLDDLGHQLLYKQLSKEYSAVIDCMEDGKGLDNYSERISALQKSSSNNTAGQTKGSANWSSSLVFENFSHDKLKSLPKSKQKQLTFKTSAQPRTISSITNSNNINHVINVDEISNNRDAKRDTKLAPIFQKPAKRKFNEEEQGTNSVNHFSNSYLQKPFRKINKSNGEPVHNGDQGPSDDSRNPFLTAGEQLTINERKKNSFRGSNEPPIANNYGSNVKKSLGTRRGVHGKFVPPVGQGKNQSTEKKECAYGENTASKKSGAASKYEQSDWMKNIDEKMIELIENEIMESGSPVTWDDIAGLEFAKTTIQEIVIWPMLRPDIFTGLRGPPKGLLLFGPPGTGKTLIGKCIASQSNATFFSISASSLTSKWVGEGEKMVRALFGVAKCHQPAVIFIDEIDSLLTQRSDSEHESSRRIKTEFLVQLDGATSMSDERILVVGATNRPQELDEAARRRLVKRLYIPLPNEKARQQIVEKLMCHQSNDLRDEDLKMITHKTHGYSGADMTSLCREAALGPIRSITDIRNVNASEVRPVCYRDFEQALKHVRPSVSQNDLISYVQWNEMYGCGSAC